jgi:GNAT superfamily N-acetyltransferase
VGRPDVPGLGRHLGHGLNDADDLTIRRATEADLPAVLELAHRSLGWSGDEDDERFFRWKHFESPFGVSPMWVGTVDERIVGFRTFLRWEFSRSDDTELLAVRAVDTATDPDFQGRGIFSRLTLHGLDELVREGVGLVFNTPNTKSLPGYLKMGWQEVGRPPVTVMGTGLMSPWALAGARAPASRYPIEMRVGETPDAVFGDPGAVARLVARVAPHVGLATRRTPEYLQWRYCFAPLRYRVALVSSSPDDGFAVFHLRRRGRAIEATVCDVLVPADTPAVEHLLMRRVAQLTSADYLLRIDRRRWMRGFVPMPRTGPILTMRSIDGRKVPTLSGLSLTMGDVEIF